MPWSPLLTGELAATATIAARDIAVAIAEDPVAAPAADRTLFWAYATATFDEAFANDAYGAAIDDLVLELRGGSSHLALHGGLAGIGWTLCHVLDADADSALRVIDDALLSILASAEWRGAHDLIEGLVGIGVYYLERIEAGAGQIACDGLAVVVDQLERAAIRTDAGVTWHTSPAILPPSFATSWPDGFFDCGVAHGAPGMVAFLARAAALDAGPTNARTLCREAMRWIEAQHGLDDIGRFPAKIITGKTPERARTAWCYGDPGIAAALWSASARLGAPSALARETAIDCAWRPIDRTGVRDAGLCHGAAGLAHLNNRFWHASGDPCFADAARTWFERALAMRRPSGIGGFAAWHAPTPDAEPAYAPIGCFLEGATGIGLALLAAVSVSEPNWDRLLLCDVPLR